jgi:transcriptional regulator GlxA family with amidase domain
MSNRNSGDEKRDYGFLLVPQFTLLAYASAIEPLRMANQLSERELYTWRTFSIDGQPVASSSGIRIPVDAAVSDDIRSTAVFVCAGIDVHRQFDPRLLPWLRKLANRKIILGALCTGSYILAEARLLKGYRCTIHWENFAGIRERHPDLVISQELFEIDRDRYTCAGGVAPMDMMLHLVRRHHGSDLATAVSEQFICERIRDNHDRQRIPLRHRIGTSQPKLMEAVSLMEANIEEPMALDELSQHIGLSRRQLERLFKKYLNCVPTRYYLQIRLERARQLLLQTSMPIVDTALACGFISAPHFSKCYRLVFGVPPREERRRAATGQQLN